MPWWGWLLIWGGLVLGLLGMLAYFAVRLFRTGMATLREAEQLAASLELLDARLDEIDPRRRPSAVFRDPAELALIVEQNREARLRYRQQRRELRLARGKLLTRSADNWTPPHA